MTKLVAQLKAKLGKVPPRPVSVIVGYTSAYALYVHENVAMKWRGLPRDRSVRLGKGGQHVTYGHNAVKAPGLFWGPTGQAKFLEAPARTFAPELGRIIRELVAKGQPLEKALLVAGLRLQRESMKLVPVEYGFLRASAFTRLEDK